MANKIKLELTWNEKVNQTKQDLHAAMQAGPRIMLETVMNHEDKNYFFDMIAIVREKLAHRQAGSFIRKYFTKARLEDIKNKIALSDAKDLEWASWQPFFLFLKDASDVEIDALDSDLRIVLDKASASEDQLCQFLKDETENDNPWRGGLFEVFAKAALLKSSAFTVEAFDWKLPNSRNIDATVRIGQRVVGVEITSRGDSAAAKGRWEKHCADVLTKDSDQAFCEFQDAYAPGRWLYGTVFNKIAPGFNSTKSQFLPDTPNLLLIKLSPVVSDLRAESPSIGWALEELFASQPSGNTSPLSLKEYLRHNLPEQDEVVNELLAAPSQLGGIILFDDRSRLRVARINGNAHESCRLYRAELAAFEETLTRLPAYCG